MTTKRNFHKSIIGRSELISFVDQGCQGLEAMPAKTDTGAYRSSVHASNIILDKASGVLSFDLLAGHPLFGANGANLKTSQFQWVVIENSFGQTEGRYEVRLKVKVGSKVFITGFTLANRSKKTFPILLGRKLINHRFLVDTSETSIDMIKLKQDFNLTEPVDEEACFAPQATNKTKESGKAQ